MAQFRFFCPKCGQRVRPKNVKFQCRHQQTEHEKKLYQDADEYLLDEISVEIIQEVE